MIAGRARSGATPAAGSRVQRRPLVARLAWTLAALLIAGALALSNGVYHPLALSAVTLAAALTLLAALAALRGEGGSGLASGGGWIAGLLAAGVAASLIQDALFAPGITVDPARLDAFRPALAAIALLLATHLWPRPPRIVATLRFPLLVAAWVVLAGAVVHASPWPGIDVWLYRQGGALALLEGRDPYAFVFRNPYGPETTVIARELLTPDGRGITALPYPPLTLLLDLPAALLGDVRWTTIVATAAAAFSIRAIGRGTRTAELAATLLLLQPATMLVIELAWTEPLVLAATTGLAVLIARGLNARATEAAQPGQGWLATGLVAGIALAAKQYTPLLLLPLLPLVDARRRWHVVAVAAALCAAIYLPFLAWDSAALWRGVVTFQLMQPFRLDALSWPAAVVTWGGPTLPSWPAFLLSALAVALTLRSAARSRSVSHALAGGAAAWLVLALGSKQAFCNYYWLAAGLLCAAIAAAARPGPTSPGSTAP